MTVCSAEDISVEVTSVGISEEGDKASSDAD